jgi:hypothetical protein
MKTKSSSHIGFGRLARLVLCALALAWVQPGYAQYHISQSVIAGGGGQASGGGWTLNATIGQPAAGTATGGGLVLNAGFWATQTQSPPTLMITRSGNNVVLSWPSAAVGFALQQTPGLAPASWAPVNIVPSDDGVTKSVTVPIANSGSFYRLAR